MNFQFHCLLGVGSKTISAARTNDLFTLLNSFSCADERDALDALLIREGPMWEFVILGAQNTTVLVVGATSSIGRIVVRMLMLSRGYTIKALVRKADQEVVDMLPKSVEIVTGDVGDTATLFSTEKESQGNSPI